MNLQTTDTIKILSFICLFFCLLGCTSAEPNSATSTAAATSPPQAISTDSPTNQPENQPTNPPLNQPTNEPTSPPSSTLRTLTVLYTNDEHGWMEGVNPDEGAANLMGLWRSEHGYEPDGPFLLLSGGDMWTGPAISTWFDGRSMVELMNEMGYRAAAVGNHEFDFGLEALQQRADEATFPLLSANIRRVDNGEVPTELGIRPYIIIPVNDISVGLIGLTTTGTPQTTNPVNVTDFEFIDYETALREIVPQVRAEGADLIMVPAHICQYELQQLAARVADLQIQLLGGGHCNELFAEQMGDTVLLEGGDSMASYAFATFEVDIASGAVTAVDIGARTNMGGSADPAVAAIVSQWQTTTSEELDVIIGYTEDGMVRQGEAMQQLIVDAWLWAIPTADVAITNMGGMRADLPPGDISLADIITVMPFNNVIVDMTVSGEQLLELLFVARDAAMGGARLDGSQWILTATGEPVDAEQTYHVLVNDFMYAGGDDYTLLAEIDPNAYNTAVDWRQPVIDWIVEQQSSVTNPLSIDE